MSDDYDEDGFENYDEDFEADEDYDVLPKSMTKPSSPPQPTRPPINLRSSTPQPRGPPSPRGSYTGQRPPSALNRRIIIPPPPQYTDAELRVQRQRLALACQKMKDVQLEEVVIDEVFSMSSLGLYDLYAMARGEYAKCKVASVQTNDDAKEEEVQTEEVPSRAYAAQIPDDRNKMSEAEVFAFSIDINKSTTAVPASLGGGTSATARVMNMEAGMEIKLASFMQWAGPLMLAALGMAPRSKTVTFGPDARGGKGLSGGTIKLSYEPLLANRPVTSVAFCPVVTEPLVVATYAPVGAQLGAAELLKDHSFSSKGCLCVWDLSAPQQPAHVLVTEGAPACATFGPAAAAHMVFAGLEEGGLCAWDLEEPSYRHPVETIGGQPQLTRRPSYTTEAHPEAGTAGPLVALAAMAKDGGGRSTPCNLVSLTAWGTVTVYTVSVLASAETDVDLGMRVGSRLRLLRLAAQVRLGMAALQPPGSPLTPIQSYCLQVLPGTMRQVVVGVDGGKVLRGSWVGLPTAPKEFIADDHTSAAAVSAVAAAAIPSSVTCLHASPHHPAAFLAGHSNGTVALHSTHTATACALWPEVAAGGVRAVRWSPSRPALFFVLDSMCNVYVFDLMQKITRPVHSEPYMANDAKTGLAAITTAMDCTSLQPGGKVTEAIPAYALGYDDGCVEVHKVVPKFVQPPAPVDRELELLSDLLGVSAA